MNKTTIFFGAIVAAIVAIAISVYYIIPGYYHVLTSSDPVKSHPTHFLLFVVIAVMCIVVALINRPRSVAR